MEKDCEVKTSSELRKTSPLFDGVSDEVIINLWANYWMIETENYSHGSCYCDLGKSADPIIKDFVQWATMSPLQIRQATIKIGE